MSLSCSDTKTNLIIIILLFSILQSIVIRLKIATLTQKVNHLQQELIIKDKNITKHK